MLEIGDWLHLLHGRERSDATIRFDERVQAHLEQAQTQLEQANLLQDLASNLTLTRHLVDMFALFDEDQFFEGVCTLCALIKEAQKRGYSDQFICQLLLFDDDQELPNEALN